MFYRQNQHQTESVLGHVTFKTVHLTLWKMNYYDKTNKTLKAPSVYVLNDYLVYT